MVFALFIFSSLIVLLSIAAASRWHKAVVLAIVGWTILQGAVAASGFFENTGTVPPRFPLAVAPPLLVIAALFAFPRTRHWLDSWNAGILTAMHSVRVPVEIGLAALYAQGLVPGEMTYHGHNFDVFSGLTAPIIGWLGYYRKVLPKAVLVGWNIFCIVLLCIVVTTAVGAVPSPIQSWCFDQPNVGVLRFPVTFLPALIVPSVLLAHLVSLRQLITGNQVAHRVLGPPTFAA